jgi:hypothetical protein
MKNFAQSCSCSPVGCLVGIWAKKIPQVVTRGGPWRSRRTTDIHGDDDTKAVRMLDAVKFDARISLAAVFGRDLTAFGNEAVLEKKGSRRFAICSYLFPSFRMARISESTCALLRNWRRERDSRLLLVLINK